MPLCILKPTYRELNYSHRTFLKHHIAANPLSSSTSWKIFSLNSHGSWTLGLFPFNTYVLHTETCVLQFLLFFLYLPLLPVRGIKCVMLMIRLGLCYHCSQSSLAPPGSCKCLPLGGFFWKQSRWLFVLHHRASHFLMTIAGFSVRWVASQPKLSCPWCLTILVSLITSIIKPGACYPRSVAHINSSTDNCVSHRVVFPICLLPLQSIYHRAATMHL